MTQKVIRHHLSRVLDWADAHVDFDTALQDIPPAIRGAQPPGLPYSPWQLLEHMRIAQYDILDFCRNPEYKEMDWPDDYWPASPAPPTEKAWAESLRMYRADRKALQEMANDPDLDLTATIPHGSGQTYLREILLVADHTAYHVGQLVTVRRLLGIWPPSD